MARTRVKMEAKYREQVRRLPTRIRVQHKRDRRVKNAQRRPVWFAMMQTDSTFLG
jgi:hypothetical protein